MFSLIERGKKSLLSQTIAEYHSQGFSPTVEAHLEWLRQRPGTKTNPVLKTKAIKFQGDFYGLCLDMGIAAEVWPAAMRLSGLLGPDQMDTDFDLITIPSKADLADLLQKYKKSS